MQFDMPKPKLIKLPFAIPRAMENTPLIFQNRALLLLNKRDDTKNPGDHYKQSMYLYCLDLATGEEVARFGAGHSFVSGCVNGDEMNVFASEGTNHNWFQDIYRFWSRDLTNWQCALAVARDGNEHLLNTSVCRDDRGFVMAYESNQPISFCFKFARSADLARWEKIAGLIFTGVNHEYSACPVIRYFAPYYYVIYLHVTVPGQRGYVSCLARSMDLAAWELSPFNPVLECDQGEGLNNSDVDLFEYQGRTYLFYATGDQSTWGAVRVALFDAPLRDFFAAYFPPGVSGIHCSARQA